MTVFSRTWDTAYEGDPADVEDINLGATRIRNGRVDVRERLEVDHSWAGDADDGMHKQLTLVGQTPAPTADGTHGLLYTSITAGVLEIFYKDNAAHTLQLTSNGLLSGACNSLTVANNAVISGSLTVDNDAVISGNLDAARISVDGDVYFYFDKFGNNPFWGVNPDTYILYDRSATEWIIADNATTIAAFSASTGLVVSVDFIALGTASVGANLGVTGEVDGNKFIVDSDPFFLLSKPTTNVCRLTLDATTYIEFDRGGNAINIVKGGVLVQTW